MDYTMLKMRVAPTHQDSISDLSGNYANAKKLPSASNSDSDHHHGLENTITTDQKQYIAEVVIDKSDPSTCVRLSSTRVNETKIKLNFSVDRLLSSDCNRLTSINDNFSTPHQPNISSVDLCANKLSTVAFNNCTSSCCNFDSAPIGSHLLQSHHLPPNGGGGSSIKTVVRPMPMRIFNSNCKLQTPQSIPLMHQQSLQQQFLKYNLHHQQNGCSMLSTLHQKSNTHRHRSPSVVVDSSNSASAINSNHVNSKRKRSWSRAVFSQLQRKGLEIQFQIQKYITKPDRRKLAARLGLSDAQVKVWFQNRRMKWRHTREQKANQSTKVLVKSDLDEEAMSKSSSSDDEEIDVVAE